MRLYNKLLIYSILCGIIIWLSIGTGVAQTPPEEKIITLDENGQTISLQFGERFLLNLGEDYDWNVTVEDQTIISRVLNVLVVRGAQGLFEAHNPGSTTLMAVGDPLCRNELPPCGAPSQEFRVTVVVSTPSTETPKSPAFEVLLTISIILVMIAVRRRRN
ncbi:MAG: hypothetical protein IBX40_12375 [Methanosarcinales archaeon]|nr:hypothetical protein [Methanosarcinales archaeon]